VRRAFPVQFALYGSIAAGVTLPLFAWVAWAFRQPAFALWSGQNQLPSPPPILYFLAYTPLAILAMSGIRWAWKRAGWKDDRYLLLIAWVAMVPILVYLPINVQRRMAEGVIVPLAILAAAALWDRRRRRFTLIIAGICSGMALAFLLFTFAASLTPGAPQYRSGTEIAAFNWLNAHAAPGAVVLAAQNTSNALPAYTHVRTVVGHGPETLDWAGKTAQLRAYFGGAMTDDARRRFLEGECLSAAPTLCADPVDYLVFGDAERLLYPDGVWRADWVEIYRMDGIIIYQRA